MEMITREWFMTGEFTTEHPIEGESITNLKGMVQERGNCCRSGLKGMVYEGESCNIEIVLRE